MDDGGQRRQHQVGNFLCDVETHGRAVVNVRRHRQRDADVFALNGRERVVGAVRVRRERAGSERHFLADEDFRFFVVERQDARRRQQVGVRCSSRSPAARRRTKSRSCSSLATAMPGDVSALAARDRHTGSDCRRHRSSCSALIIAAIDGLSAVLINGTESPLVSTPAKSTPQFRRVVERDFDDRGFDQHLRAAHVEVVITISMISLIVGRIGAHDDGVRWFRRPGC